MSRPIYVGANISTTHTFSQWLNKSNQIIYDMGTVVVTTTPFPQPNSINGGITVGNAHIEGFLSANTLVAKDSLRGGTVSVPANLVVSTNTIFSQSALIHIQPNTQNFNVNANNSLFTGNFAMSNTAKTFNITANSTTIAHGPFTVSANSTFSGSNVHINGTNFVITSNTNLTATSTTLNSNVQINGANTNVNSSIVNIGSSNTQTLFINSKLGQTITPSNTSVNLGSLTANFGNAHLTEVFANSVYLDGYIEIEGNGRQTISTKAIDSNNTSSLMFSFRNSANTEVNAYYFDQASLFPKANSTVSLGTTTNRFGAFFTNVATITTDIAVGNSANITSQANAATVRARNLVGGRVTFANTTNFLVDSANFTYNGTTLTINTAATANGLAVVGGGTFGGIVTITGNTVVNDNFTVNGNNAQFAGMANTLNATVRSVNTQNIMYSSNGLVVGTDNFIYNNTELRIITPNATTVAINTNGSADISGSGIFGANVSVGSILNVTSYSNSASIRARNLSSTRIPFANSTNFLVDSANFTYNGTALTITTANTATGLIVAGAATFGGSITTSGNAAIGDNLTVAGNTATFGGLVNTNSLTVRNFNDKSVAFSSNGSLSSNANFVYDETASRLTINGAAATVVAINTSGSIDATGSGIFGANVSVGNILNVTNQANASVLRARSLVGTRIPFANNTSFLVDSANFTYNGTTLTINTAAASIGVSSPGGATFGGTFNADGAATFGNNVNISGTITTSGVSNIGTQSNTQTLRIRSANANQILYSQNSSGFITGSDSFAYDGTTLIINSGNSSSNSISTTGNINSGGSMQVGGNVAVLGSTEIVGNLTVIGNTTLSSNSQLALNTSTINYLTVGAEITMNGTARLVGNLIPKTNNAQDLGSNALTYRTVYANNFVGNLAWSNLDNVPSPVLTFSGGDTTGTGTMTSLGGVTINLTTRNANSTVSGVINTAAQTFTGAKTFSGGVVGALTGNATTATTLATARTINGTSFNGSANITTPARIRRATETANTTVPLMILHNATYNDTADMALNDVGISNRLNYHIESGTATSVYFNSSSDSRLKINVSTIENALEKVNKMRGVEYDRIDVDGHHVGVIAQEMEEIIPEVIHTDNEGYKYVAYDNLVGVLIESIKELTQKVEDLENKLKDKK